MHICRFIEFSLSNQLWVVDRPLSADWLHGVPSLIFSFDLILEMGKTFKTLKILFGLTIFPTGEKAAY